MAISKDFLWNTLSRLTDEIERLDPQSVIAARVRGILAVREMLTATGDRHPRSNKAERDDRIASLYLGGATIAQVAATMGCASATVASALQRRGVEARKPGECQKVSRQRANQEQLERIREMRAKGLTLEEIGSAERITRERVRQICAKNNIDTSFRPLRPDELGIVAEYLAGDSLNVVAERHHTTLGVIRNLVTRSGNDVRPNRRECKHLPETLARAERAAQLYAEGKTTFEIQAALGVRAPATYRLLAIAGVSPNRRPRNRAQVPA